MEVRSGVSDLTNTSTDGASVATKVVTDSPDKKEENPATPIKELFSFTDSPPSTPKDVHNTALSPTLGQMHSTLASKMAELNMSLEEPPPGTSPPLVPTGKSLLNTKLAKSKEVPPLQHMNPVVTTTPVVASKIPDTTPASAKSPGFFQRTAQMTALQANTS
jgi:hypothetical protein